MSNLKKIKKMKKFLLSLGLMAMAFNLTSCMKSEEITPSVESNGDFEIYASITRTENDGMNTVWSEGDMINLFHAVTDTDEYVNDTPYKDGASYPFKCVDAASGSFMGTVDGELDLEEEYDWYALYPYSSYVVTPANNGNGYLPIGCKSNQVQYQGANNSMSPIAGENYPMVGYAVAVPGNGTPHLEFTHVSSLVEFEVVNKTSADIKVSNIQFTATEDIVGTYYINFADSKNLTFKSSGSNYVSNTATLSVTGNEAIAAGASAKFYLAVKPFTAPADGELAVKVVASTENGVGVHEANIELAKATTFAPGKIKTIKVNYTTVVEAPEEGDDETEWVNNAFNLVPSVSALKVGDEVVIVASKFNKAMGLISGNGNNRMSAPVTKNSNNTVDFDTKTAVFTVAAGNATGTYAFNYGGKYIYAAGGSSSNYLKEESAVSSKSSWTISIVDGVANIVASDTATTRNTMRYNSDSDLFSCYDTSSSDQATIGIYKKVGEYTPATPAIEIAASDASIAYNATSGAINLSLAYATGWKITATADQTWVKDFAYDSAKSAITFTSEANEGDERTANVTITATCDGYDDVVKSVVVKQAAKPSGDISQGESYTYTFTSSQFSGNQTKTLSGLAWTLAGDGGYWGLDSNGRGQQFGSGSKPYKNLTLKTSAYEGGVKTIKINASGASGTNAKMTVSVGGTQVGSQVSLTTSAKDYTFTSTELLVGDIVISITQTSTKAIYIKSISIN